MNEKLLLERTGSQRPTAGRCAGVKFLSLAKATAAKEPRRSLRLALYRARAARGLPLFG